MVILRADRVGAAVMFGALSLGSAIALVVAGGGETPLQLLEAHVNQTASISSASRMEEAASVWSETAAEHVPTLDELAERVIAEHARDYSVTHDEAAHRLGTDAYLFALVAYLEDYEQAVYTELRIMNEPEERIEKEPQHYLRLMLKPEGIERIRAMVERTPLAGSVEYVAADWSLEQLREQADTATEQLNAVGVVFSQGIVGQDVQLFVLDLADTEARMAAGGVVLPPAVKIFESTDIGSPDVDVPPTEVPATPTIEPASEACAEQFVVPTPPAGAEPDLVMETSALVGYLEACEADVYTELRVEHHATHAITLMVRPEGLERIQAKIESGPLAGHVTYVPSEWTLVELRELQTLATQQLGEVGLNFMSSITGQTVQIMVLDRVGTLESITAAGVELHPAIEIVEVAGMATPAAGSDDMVPAGGLATPEDDAR